LEQVNSEKVVGWQIQSILMHTVEKFGRNHQSKQYFALY